MGGLAAMLISLQSTMEFITITKGKPALLFDGSQFTLNRRMDNNMLVLGTSENLSKLADLDTIYVDGTFATCPSLYCQLFTIKTSKPV